MPLTEDQKLRMEQKKAEALARIKSRNPGTPIKSHASNSKSTLSQELAKVASETKLLFQDNKQQSTCSTTKTNSENRSSYKPNVMTVLSNNSSSLSDQQRIMLEEKRKAAKLMQQNKVTSLMSKTSTPSVSNLPVPVEVKRANNTNNFYSQPRIIKGSCSLISTSRFELDVSYHKQLIDLVKTVGSAQYNATKKSWTFNISDHDLLHQKLRCLKPEVEISNLPHWILQTFSKPRDLTPALVDLSSIDPYLLENLMPFQKEGIKYGVSREGRVLIADDMGLGKTVQALGLVSYYKESWPVLIVCQSTLKFSWQQSILRWLPSTVIETDVGVIATGKDYMGSDLFTIVSYDLVTKKQNELMKKNFQFIILDESHCIKDFKSARTKAVEPLLKSCKHLVLLSGTPALSRPIELYPQVSALDPKMFRWVSEFGNRYCDGKMKRFGDREVPDYSGSSHMLELSLLLSERCMIRRLKSEVLSELPSKQRISIILDPAGVDSRSQVMKDKRKETEKKGLNGSERHGLVLQWFATTATAKLKAVKEYIKSLVTNSETKFLVFAHHQVMLSAVAKLMEELKVGFIYIDGSVSSEMRKERVDKFQNSDKVRTAVLSITAANAGITLTAANLVVFAELFWNPGVLTQAEDRAHRIGQTDSVTVQYLVAKDTADDVLWPLIQNKLDVLNKAGLSKDNFENSEAKVMEDTSKQTKVDDFFNSSRTSATDDEIEALWNSLEDDDFEESDSKRIKLG